MSVDQLIQEAGQLLQRGQRDAATAVLSRAVKSDPEHPVANQWLGSVHAQAGRFKEAAACLEVAARGMPGNTGVWLNLGMMRSTVGDLAGAEEAFRRAIELDPRATDANLCLGMLLANQQRTGDADPFFRRASELAPSRADIAHTYSRVLADSGRIEEALDIVRRAQRHVPSDAMLQDKICCLLNYIAGTRPEDSLKEHQKYGALIGRPAPIHRVTDKSPTRKLRIAYLSGDLREHSVSYFLEPVLEHRDRSSFEVVCFHIGPPDDRTTPRLRAKSDRWRHLFPVTDEALRTAIADDQIDILVELAGHAQGNRLAALAAAPAPIIVTYIGYPNTTGVPAIGYRIVDARTDPPGAKSLATESLIRLEGCFLCYRPFEDAPAVERSPSDHITFGSFNNLAKLSGPTLDAWGKLLARIPGSRLMLKGKGLGDPFVSGRILSRLAAAGIAPERVELLGHTQTTQEHLSAYNRMDIALDPFPYHGTTTTCEALYMGVPVVTLAGLVHAQRVGVSLLETVGVPELIASSEENYISIAETLARDASRLSTYHATLRERVKSSRLCDGASYTRGLERAYRHMWQEWCGQGAAPAAAPQAPKKEPGGFLGKLFGKR